MPPDPSSSPLFNSDIFVKEFTDLQTKMVQLTSMIRNFAEFDLEGKKIFVSQLDEVADKMKVVLTRMKLADDPFGNWVMQQQNVQMLNANTNWDIILEGLRSETVEMRKLIELEESTADPRRLAQIKDAWNQKFSGAPTMSPADLQLDPELAKAAMHPEAMKAVTEVLANPQAIEKYRDGPLYKFLQRALKGQF